MKAKRNLLALLLSVVIFWQGFSVVNAENVSPTPESSISLSSSDVEEEGNRTEITGVNPEDTENDLEEASLSNSADSTDILTMARAASLVGTGVERSDVIQNIRMTLNGNPIDENTKIYANTDFALKIKLAVSGKTVNNGDYAVVQLPGSLAAVSEDTEIKNDAGQVMANAHYDSTTKQLKIIFTENAENYSGADGEFTFLVRVNQSEGDTAKQVPINIPFNGRTFSIKLNYQGIGLDEEPNFWKNYGGSIEQYEDREGTIHYLVHFFIQVNGRRLTRVGTVSEKFTNIEIHDKLISDVFSYVDPSDPEHSMNWKNASDADRFYPTLVRGVWRSGYRDEDYVFHPATDDGANRGPKWALQDVDNNALPARGDRVPLKYKDGKRAFDYRVGDLNVEEGFELQYYVEVNEVPQDGTVYRNDASITGDSISMGTHKREVPVQSSSGNLNGTGFTLRIEKKNEEGQPLSGAEFTIENKRTKVKKTVVTNADGIATLENAVLADYIIKEIKAPTGYVLDEQEQQEVGKEELKSSAAGNATVTKIFVNKKANEAKPETRSVLVDKKWIQGNSTVAKPNKVKVYLVENGKKTDKVQELSEENGWKASFSNLPKKDASGAEITYTVAEENLQDYKPAIAGTQDTGFTITNYTGDRIAIPVTKIWKGSGNHPLGITIQLFADGNRVSSIYLTAEHGWQYTFDMPKYNAARQEINYTVTEENVYGYTATRADDENSGYKNVFVNTKDKPNNPGGGGNTPNNPGGGGNTPKTPSGNTPKDPGTPPPSTPDEPGKVLGASRPMEENPERKGEVLGESRPAVKGRAATKTEDKAAMKLYGVLFTLSLISFSASLFGKKFFLKKRES